jgi:PAS domain S-box-containing protein
MLNPHPQRPLQAALVVFLLAAIASVALICLSDQSDRQEARARVSNMAGERARNLQHSIERDLSSAYALASLVRQGKGTIANFDEVAGEMLAFYPGVSELALAPGGIIRDVVPKAGKEQALGPRLPLEPAQKPEALRARNGGKLTLAGPLDLDQGGRGLVGRLPVFLDAPPGEPHFWGYTLVVIRLPEALETVNLSQLAKQGFDYELWRKRPGSGQKQIIAASASAVLSDPVTSALQLPNATWTLDVAPIGGWGNPSQLALESALGLFVSLLLAYLAKSLLELKLHRDGLEALVGQRTAELSAREAELNHAQAVAGVGSWRFNPATGEMHGSAQALRILGANDNRPISYRTFLSLVHPDDREVVDLATRAALKSKPYDVEYRLLAGATTRWVHSKAELSFDAHEKLSSALGTIQDITEQKRAEAALRARESRYRELFEANPHPMWVWDLHTMAFLAVNDAAVAHYGYSRDEFLAMLVTDIRPAEELPRLLKRVALLQKQAIRDAGLWRHRKKDGTLIDVEIASHMLEFDGRHAQMTLVNDVTERVDAERRLRASEARFRSLTAMSSDFYWESDAEHRLTLISSGAGGDPARDLPQGSPLGKRRWDSPYLSPDEKGWAAHRATLDKRRPFRDFEFSRMGSAGVVLHMAISGDPIFDVSGVFLGYRGVGKHVSERKAAEAKIARLIQLYAALGQCNQAIMRGLSEEDVLEQICRAAVDFGGMKFAWVGWVDQESRRVKPVASYGQGTEYLQSVEISVDAADPSGRGPSGVAARENRPVWCQDFLSDPMTAPWHERGTRQGWRASAALPLHRDNAVVGVFNLYAGENNAFDDAARELLLEMASDISFELDYFERESRRRRAERELKESEQRLRLALNSAAMAAWEWDVTPDVLTWSEHPGALLGPEPTGGYPDFRELLHPDDVAAFIQCGRRAITESAPYHAVFRITRTDGAVRWIEAQGVFLDSEGKEHRKRIIGVSQDITERRQNEIELRRLNEELERRVAERTHALELANIELEAISYSVSHGLRAPLQAVQGFSYKLEKEYAGRIDEAGRDMLGRVRAGARQIATLTDGLLNLSRISRQAMRAEPVDLSSLAREVADELQAGEPERRAEWIIAPRLSAEGDPDLLRVVLRNLIGNAWKYSSRREVARIEFGMEEQDGRNVYFVRDNGEGFDMDRARKLFDPLQRLHAEAEFPGSGTGLATVERILHRHGGRAWAEARIGEGATFYFTLD